MTPNLAIGYVDTIHHLVRGPLDLSAFAEGYAGARKFGSKWKRDFGVTGGLRLTW